MVVEKLTIMATKEGQNAFADPKIAGWFILAFIYIYIYTYIYIIYNYIYIHDYICICIYIYWLYRMENPSEISYVD